MTLIKESIPIKRTTHHHHTTIKRTIISRSNSNISSAGIDPEIYNTHSFRLHKIPIHHESSGCLNFNNRPHSREYFQSQLFPNSHSHLSPARSTTCITKSTDSGTEIPIKFLRFEDDCRPPRHSCHNASTTRLDSRVPTQNNINIKNNIKWSHSKSSSDLELNLEIKTPERDIIISKRLHHPVSCPFNTFSMLIFYYYFSKMKRILRNILY